MNDSENNSTEPCPNCNSNDVSSYYDHEIPLAKLRCKNSDCDVSTFETEKRYSSIDTEQ